MAADDYPEGDGESPSRRGVKQAAANQGRCDDAHAFLGVVGAVAKTKERGGKKLQSAEPAVDFQRALVADDPTGESREKNGKHHAKDRRQKNEKNGLDPALENQRLEPHVSHCSAAVAAHEGVRRTGGQAENQSGEVPGDGAKEAGENHLLVDQVDLDEAFSNGAGDGRAEEEGGNKIPKGGPGDGAERGQDACGDHGGNGIGGVMPRSEEHTSEL